MIPTRPDKLVPVAIGIPTYNGSRHIRQTLQSVLAQTHGALYVIVVDDGSTDETVSLVETVAAADARVRLHRQANSGIATARNVCFELASGTAEYFLFLDHDDLLLPDAIRLLLSALLARPEYAAAHGKTAIIDEQGDPVPLDSALIARLGLERKRLRSSAFRDSFRSAVVQSDEEDTSYATLLYANCITSVGAALFRTGALKAAGPVFQSEFVPNDEWELYLRVALQGAFAFVPDTVLQWRLHATNSSANTTRMRDAYLRILKHVAASRPPEPYRRQLKAALLYRAAAMSRVVLLHPSKVTTERQEIGRVMRAAVMGILGI